MSLSRPQGLLKLALTIITALSVMYSSTASAQTPSGTTLKTVSQTKVKAAKNPVIKPVKRKVNKVTKKKAAPEVPVTAEAHIPDTAPTEAQVAEVPAPKFGSTFDYAQAHVPTKEQTRQLECLTTNIYWEAASEPYDGKVAVAQVTMNRTRSGKFPDTVCGVVYQKTRISDKTICQFSWACEARKKKVVDRLWAESEEVARRVMLEGHRLPKMENAMYFHATHVRPNWGKKQVGRIGNHIFFSDHRVKHDNSI